MMNRMGAQQIDHLPVGAPPQRTLLSGPDASAELHGSWGRAQSGGTSPCGGCQVTLGTCSVPPTAAHLFLHTSGSVVRPWRPLSRSGLFIFLQAARASLLGLLVRIKDDVGEQQACARPLRSSPHCRSPWPACTSGHRLLSWVPVAWRTTGPQGTGSMTLIWSRIYLVPRCCGTN